jgi:negative modulator of initiation of replication
VATIEIDDELYRYLLSKLQRFEETPSEIIRRLIGISTPTNGNLRPSAPGPGTGNSAASVTNHLLGDELDVSSFLSSPTFRSERQAVGKFLSILSWLYGRDEEKFKLEVLPIGGRTRKYFALSEQELNDSGNSVNPQMIPRSIIWVVTNNDTPKKRTMIRDVMTALGFSEGSIKLMEHALT